MINASRITYLEQLHNGNLENNSIGILDYIKRNGPKSTEELRNELIYPHQTLTGSLSVLTDLGLIKVIKTVSKVTKERKSTFSVYEFVQSEIEQVILQDERELERAKKWLKGYEKYKGILKVSLIEY
jgi:predicted transcriptional regulator